MKQIDIYGNEVEVVDTPIEHKTMKQKFREKHGFLQGKYCKDCKFHHRFDYHYKYYHKCEKLGMSNSEATDIRIKDIACRLYEEE